MGRLARHGVALRWGSRKLGRGGDEQGNREERKGRHGNALDQLDRAGAVQLRHRDLLRVRGTSVPQRVKEEPSVAVPQVPQGNR
jgi:hypothetical protein